MVEETPTAAAAQGRADGLPWREEHADVGAGRGARADDDVAEEVC